MFAYVVIYYALLAVCTICVSLYFMHKTRHGWH